MKILVLGATGGTGRGIVSQALERGHIVTALVRSPEKISARHENLIVKKGNVTSESDLSQNLEGQDAVLSALGPVDLKPNSILRDSALALMEAMKANGIKRILLVSVSTLFPKGLPGGPLLYIIRYVLRNTIQGAKEMEEIVRASDLDWTIVRPPRLTDQNNFEYRVRVNAFPENGRGTLARKAVAKFMLDALEQKEHVGEIVGIAR